MALPNMSPEYYENLAAYSDWQQATGQPPQLGGENLSDPAFLAWRTQANADSANTNPNSLASISAEPPYSDEDVETVKTLLNTGEVSIESVSTHFSVPVNAIIENLTGVPRDTYTSGNSTPETVNAVMKLINSGVASSGNIADYLSATVADVESYLTDVELYTAEDIANAATGERIASADVRNIEADGDYTQEEIKMVTDAINSGLLSSAQVAQQFNVTEDSVNTELEAINARDAAAAKAATDAQAKAAADAKAAATLSANAAANNLTLDTAGANIQTGLLGSETALKTGATNAIAALDALNASGRSDLTTQNAAALASAEAQKAIAEQAIRAGTTQGVNAFNTAVTGGRQDLRGEYATALEKAVAQNTISRNDITSGRTSGLEALKTGLDAGATSLKTNYDTALDKAVAQAAIARGDITGAETRGMEALNQGLGAARTDITDSFGRAESMFNPYKEAGTTALQQQMALSGALGQDAFNAAYQESPQMAFLREQGMRANLAGAGATGGLGGGNVQKELARFGQGLASQGLQQQIANLSGLSGQGLNAAGSASNIATSGGTNLANLGIAGGQAGLQSAMSSGSNLSNIASNLGSQQLQANMNLGNQLSGLDVASGQAGLQAFTNEGQNLANLAQTLGGQQLQTGTNLGGNLADMRMAQGQAQLGAYMGQGSNLANLASGLGAQQLQTQSALGSRLSDYNLRTGLPGVSTINNLGTNLAAGRTRAGEQLASQYGAAANAMGNMYSNQGRNIGNTIEAQRIALINQVNSGAMTEAQAQQAYSTAMANIQGGVGTALAGVQQAPLVSPNYAQGVGNALQAGGAAYDLFKGSQNNSQNTNYQGYGNAAAQIANQAY